MLSAVEHIRWGTTILCRDNGSKEQRQESAQSVQKNGNSSVQLDYRINGESAGRQRWLWRKKRSKLIG